MEKIRKYIFIGIACCVVFAIGIIVFIEISKEKELKDNSMCFFKYMSDQMYENDGGKSEPILLNIEYRFTENENLRGDFYFTDEKVIKEFIDMIKEINVMKISEEDYNLLNEQDASSAAVYIYYPKSSINFRWIETDELPTIFEIETILFPMDFDYKDEEIYTYYGKYIKNKNAIDDVVRKFVEQHTSNLSLDDVKRIVAQEKMDYFDFSTYRSKYVDGGNSLYNTVIYPIENTEYEVKIKVSAEWHTVEGKEMEFDGKMQKYKGEEIVYNMSEVWLCDKDGNQINLMTDKNIDEFINR